MRQGPALVEGRTGGRRIRPLPPHFGRTLPPACDLRPTRLQPRPPSNPPQSIVDAEWNIIYDKLAKCVDSGAQVRRRRAAEGVGAGAVGLGLGRGPTHYCTLQRALSRVCRKPPIALQARTHACMRTLTYTHAHTHPTLPRPRSSCRAWPSATWARSTSRTAACSAPAASQRRTCSASQRPQVRGGPSGPRALRF